MTFIKTWCVDDLNQVVGGRQVCRAHNVPLSDKKWNSSSSVPSAGVLSGVTAAWTLFRSLISSECVCPAASMCALSAHNILEETQIQRKKRRGSRTIRTTHEIKLWGGLWPFISVRHWLAHVFTHWKTSDLCHWQPKDKPWSYVTFICTSSAKYSQTQSQILGSNQINDVTLTQPTLRLESNWQKMWWNRYPVFLMNCINYLLAKVIYCY